MLWHARPPRRGTAKGMIFIRQPNLPRRRGSTTLGLMGHRPVMTHVRNWKIQKPPSRGTWADLLATISGSLAIHSGLPS